jgi:dihydroorotate dehydrogenase electron transfer subunit
MSLVNEVATIISNEKLGPRLYLMKLISPQIAKGILPGQFVHMQIPGMPDHILRRPFSIFSANAQAGACEILYQVVGAGSNHMTTLTEGVTCELIGPVGRPWQPAVDCKRALIVGGGVGAAPLYMLTEQLCKSGVNVTVILGAANAESLVCKPKYDELVTHSPNLKLVFATDNGSFGIKGFCTVPAQEEISAAADAGNQFDYLAVCGPEPLMRAVSQISAQAGIPTQVSMEKRMACGIGACLSCIVETTAGRKRACVDGPIFDASEVVW